MKKKFIAVSVLLCALALSSTTLTSCVDDNESASVTAIRDAKAKQLTALANYTDVKAQNETIIAAAEAALKNAKAKAQEIKNSLKDLELQKAQAALADEIEAAKAKAQAELLSQKAALEQAKAELIKASTAADEATQQKISELIAEADKIMYTDGPNSIYGSNGLNDRLIEKKADRVKAEYDLANVKLQIAEEVRKEEKKLAVNEALLAEYKKYDNTDLDAAEKAANEAYQKLPALEEVKDDAYALYGTEWAKVTSAENDIKKTEVIKYRDGNVNGDRIAYYVTYEYPERKTFTVNYDDGTSATTFTDYNTPQMVVQTEMLTTAITNADRAVKVAEQNLANAEKTQADGLKDDAITDDGTTTYKQLKDAVTEALKAFEKEPTDANKSTLAYVEGKVKEYENGLQKNVDRAQEALDGAKKEQTILNEINTLLTGEAFKNYTTVYNAYVTAVDASVETWIAAMKADHNYKVQNNLYRSLSYIADSYTDWQTLISQTEQAINTNKKNIATMTDDNGDTEATKQKYMEILDQEIADLERNIQIKQNQYDSYMKQIEALINGDTIPEVPETPSEGGNEETPAE